MTMQITSSAFTQGGSIPKKYSCDGENISPPLSWSGVPGDAKSLALIIEDPDAPSGIFVHWLIYNLDPSTKGLAEGASQNAASLGKQANNSAGKSGYSGPCPPRGSEHRYYFRIYALDTQLDLGPGASKVELEKAMRGRALATGELMGTFSR